MANHRRKRPGTRTFGNRSRDKWSVKEIEERGVHYHWLGSWPAYWDIIYLRRPVRRRDKAVARAVLMDRVDADEAIWSLHKKPHHYYW